MHPVFAANKAELKPLVKVLEKLRTATQVDLKINRTIKSEFGADKKSQGNFIFSGNLFCLELASGSKDAKEKVVFDGKTLWVIQYPEDSKLESIQVLKTTMQGNLKEKGLLTDLLVRGRLMSAFNISTDESVLKGTDESDKKSVDKNIFFYVGTPKSKNDEIKKIRISVSDGQLKSLTYEDDIGNETSFEILNQKILTKKDTKQFQFIPPKGAQISNL